MNDQGEEGAEHMVIRVETEGLSGRDRIFPTGVQGLTEEVALQICANYDAGHAKASPPSEKITIIHRVVTAKEYQAMVQDRKRA